MFGEFFAVFLFEHFLLFVHAIHESLGRKHLQKRVKAYEGGYTGYVGEGGRGDGRGGGRQAKIGRAHV